MRSAGHAIGFVLATVVNILNPSRLVLAGELSNARDFLLGALRETLYREANTLATSELEISRARAGARAGIIGVSTMALEHALSTAQSRLFPGARRPVAMAVARAAAVVLAGLAVRRLLRPEVGRDRPAPAAAG